MIPAIAPKILNMDVSNETLIHIAINIRMIPSINIFNLLEFQYNTIQGQGSESCF